MPYSERIDPIPDLFAHTPARYPELNGKVAIVTGSSRGIGLSIAVRFAREGMMVVINSRSDEDVAQVAGDLQALGVEALGVAADLGDRTALQTLFDRTIECFGTVDVLVNNAASLRRKPLFDIPDELFDSQLQTNIAAPYYLSRLTAIHLHKQGKGGSIINISSIGSIQAHIPALPYDMTKTALNMLTMAMASELGRKGIRVNAIAPGSIRTYEVSGEEKIRWEKSQTRIPLLRSGEPDEIASVAAFLASDDASYINGVVLPVDGGVLAQLHPQGEPI
jgi:NAD(P)-dependent dehydrogenase (short-subunit alcohol dehydrogenase family)